MIEADKRKAVFLLHQEGMSAREIARRLGLGRNTVRAIIGQEGAMPQAVRKDKQHIDEELLRHLYQECQGRMARVHEKLVEEEGLTVTYSTLTRMLRQLGISQAPQSRCGRVPDEPGAEMQHDTSVYPIELAGRTVKLIASLLYLRYSKRRYLQFYRAFDRFRLKCFLHQTLVFWGYAPRQCIIDNTNLARLRGTGANALIVPEMEAFAKSYGFEFRCHALKHSDRKAGEERSFWTVETNFFPGRSFQNLEDLNEQALAWSTTRWDNRAQGKAGLIPAQAFEYERAFLTQLPAYLPAPYRVHDRGTDQYGYACFGANYYWVPGTGREQIKILEYSDRLKLYLARECLAEYSLPADGVKDGQFHPPGLPTPRHHASNRRHPTQAEEKYLRALDPLVNAYLDFALSTKGLQRHEFIRKLVTLSRKMTLPLFRQSLERAGKYRITSLPTVERIASLYLQADNQTLPLVQIDEAFREREAYREGSFTEAPDLSVYQEPQTDHEQRPD